MPAAAPVLPVSGPALLDQLLSDPSSMDVPLEHVLLKEVHKGTSDKLIIHIQDAHSNLSGQENLAAALKHFLSKYEVPLVLVEGADRDVSLNAVRQEVPEDVRRRAAKRLLYDVVIAGEEYVNLTENFPMSLRGVERGDLYEKSVEAYAELVKRRKDIQVYLYKARVSLERVKQKLYSKDLIAYEEFKKQDSSARTQSTDDRMRG